MNPYSVLLLRPDNVADTFGHDTYLAHVDACSVPLAVEKAQMEAWVADNGGPDNVPDDAGDPDDYHVLFVCRGHQEDISPEYTGQGS